MVYDYLSEMRKTLTLIAYILTKMCGMICTNFIRPDMRLAYIKIHVWQSDKLIIDQADKHSCSSHINVNINCVGKLLYICEK